MILRSPRDGSYWRASLGQVPWQAQSCEANVTQQRPWLSNCIMNNYGGQLVHQELCSEHSSLQEREASSAHMISVNPNIYWGRTSENVRAHKMLWLQTWSIYRVSECRRLRHRNLSLSISTDHPASAGIIPSSVGGPTSTKSIARLCSLIK